MKIVFYLFGLFQIVEINKVEEEGSKYLTIIGLPTWFSGVTNLKNIEGSIGIV